MTLSTSANLDNAPPAGRLGARELGWILLCALGAVGALLTGGLAAAACAALSVAACVGACLMRGTATPAGSVVREAEAEAEKAGFAGARLMLAEVVPVWRRQLETTRRTADDGFQHISGSFAEVVESLSQLIEGSSAAANPVQFDNLSTVLDQRVELLEELLPVLRQSHQRSAALSQAVHRTGEALQGVGRVTRELKGFARHIRLVSMNAAIEANRAPVELRAGLNAVAHEVRDLADTARQMAAGLEVHARVIDEQVAPLREAGSDSAPGDAEIQAELRLRAHRVLSGLMSEVGRSLESSQASREAAARLREKFEELLLSVQVGDRVNQMLDILGADLDRLVEWNVMHSQARKADALAWLESLAGRYTTDEQRQQHHGTVAIQRQAEVEFF